MIKSTAIGLSPKIDQVDAIEGVDAERVSVRAIQTTRREANVNNSPRHQQGRAGCGAAQYSPLRARSFRRGSAASSPVFDCPVHRDGGGDLRASGQEIDPQGGRSPPLDR